MVVTKCQHEFFECGIMPLMWQAINGILHDANLNLTLTSIAALPEFLYNAHNPEFNLRTIVNQGPPIRPQTGSTPPNFHYFDKNQLFDLRPDLARSWVLPGDWRPRNAILSTF